MENDRSVLAYVDVFLPANGVSLEYNMPIERILCKLFIKQINNKLPVLLWFVF